MFAVFAVRREAYLLQQERIDKLIEVMAAGPDYCREHNTAFHEACCLRYPQISAPDTYLQRINYTFNEQSRQDLLFYLAKARQFGLLPDEIQPEFIQPQPRENS